MRFSQLERAEQLALYMKYKAGEDLTAEAERFGCKVSSLERTLRRWAARQVEPSKKPQYREPPRVEGNVLVLADPHVPYHDASFINKAIDVALAGKVEACIIAGDMFDVNAFSPFDPNLADVLEDEFAAGEAFITTLAETFKEILVLTGNHEGRILKRLGFHQIEHNRLKRLFDPEDVAEFSPYYFCYVQDWMVCHPKNVSSIPGRVAARLAEKYHCNVVAAHGHTFGLAQDVSGQYLGIDSGCCADPSRLEYIALRPNLRPQVHQGAVILQDGYPWLLNRHLDTNRIKQALRR